MKSTIQTFARQVVSLVCILVAGEAFADSSLYVVSAGDRIRRFTVDAQGGLALADNDFIVKDGANDVLTRPIKIVRVGRVFYVLDSYADSNLGYFSVAKFDLMGNFLGKLVHRGANVLNGKLGKADGMAASPDGDWLYVGDFTLGVVFRVRVATGEISTFVTGLSQPRDLHVTSDGRLYVAARGNKRVFVFNPDGSASSPVSYSFSDQVGGIYVDEANGKLYGRYDGKMQVHNLGTDAVVETVKMPGNGLAIEKVGAQLVSGNWTIWDPQSILFTCNLSNAYAIETVAHGLGDVQDVYLDSHDDSSVSPLLAHTSLASARNTLFFAADNAQSAVGDAARATVWRSQDGGAHWTEVATVEAANPTFVERPEDGLMLLVEPCRAADEQQTFAVAEFAADGTLTPSFVVTNKTGHVFTPANGRMVASSWGFAGVRAGLGLATARANTMAAFSFVPDRTSSAFPDAVFTANVTTNDWSSNPAFARRPWCDVLPPLVFRDRDGNHRELVPAVQARTSVATRVGPEYALTTESQNALGQFSPKWAPVATGRMALPGASKAFDVVYDAVSELYWAVTIPATNTLDLVARDPGEIRNVLALYASSDLATWRLCRVLRAEGSPETVAFSNPLLVVDDDDLVVSYSAVGADVTGQTAIGTSGNFFCLRVVDFRATWPGAFETSQVFAICEFNAGIVKSCRQDPLSGAWTHAPLVTNGVYFGRHLSSLSGLAALAARLYVTSERQGVFAFSFKGRVRGFWPKPDDMGQCDAICPASDGHTLLVTDSSATSVNSVRRFNPSSGVWTTLVSAAKDETLKTPRGICAMSDSSFFVALRSNGEVRHYVADGSSYEKVGTFAGAISVMLDADEANLFVGTRHGRIAKVNLSDKSSFDLAAPLKDLDGAAYALALHNGRLWVVDSGAGHIWSLDPDEPYQTPRVECAGFDFPARGAFLDLADRCGGIFILR